MLFIRNSFPIQLVVWEKVYHENSNFEEQGSYINIQWSRLKNKKITTGKGGHHITVKGSIHQMNQ